MQENPTQVISEDEMEQWIDCFEKESFKVSTLIDPSVKFTLPMALQKAAATKWIVHAQLGQSSSSSSSSSSGTGSNQDSKGDRMLCVIGKE
jgi:hypothetical protein